MALRKLRSLALAELRLRAPSLHAGALNWWNRRLERAHWRMRIENVLACPDRARLHAVSNAGAIVNGFQVMHNGIRVKADGYYGRDITRMLGLSGGCHEPQEELVFQAVLGKMTAGATIVECGAYWGYYSMWFCGSVHDARAYLVEPDAENLAVGRENFRENRMHAEFIHAYVGTAAGTAPDGTQVECIDDLAASRALEVIDILHADIQGAELEMLRGAARTLAGQRARYVFLSTHSNELHASCEALLRGHGYRIVASVNLDDSYSCDGILVAASARADIDGLPVPSLKTKVRSDRGDS
jgi:Methyltransferase FkbM domain